MRRLIRAAETLDSALLALVLLGPLAFFFGRVAPWQLKAAAALSEPGLRQATAGSLILAVVTALTSTTLAFGFSWLLWRFDWPEWLRQAAELLLKLPYLLPPFFLAIGWIALAAPEVGYLNRLAIALHLPRLPALYGLGGAIFVETLWTTALAMIHLRSFFTRYPGHLEDAAILCGASPLRALARITAPLARPYLFSCLLLTSVSSLSAFGVPAMLASPARSFVLTTRIYQGIKSSQDFAQAGWLSLILLVITAGLLALQRLSERGATSALVGGKAGRPARLAPTTPARGFLAAALGFALLSCLLPCAAIALQSLLRDPADLTSISLDKYVYVFTRTPESWLGLRNSLVTAAFTATIATVLGAVIAYGAARLRLRTSRVLTELWNLGYALPGTVIALALLVFYAGSLTDTLLILALAYLAKYAAFALRTLTPATAALGRELEEAAWMSGASPVRAFMRILVPLLRPALAAALMLAFIPMLSELTMSVLLVGPGTPTLGSVIYNMQEYADPGAAAVLATVVVLSIIALNALLKKLSRGAFGI